MQQVWVMPLLELRDPRDLWQTDRLGADRGELGRGVHSTMSAQQRDEGGLAP
jgi:hypothetical protein